jgi:hypothetical protein
MSVENTFLALLNMPRIQQVADPYNLTHVHTTAFVQLPNGRKISCNQDADIVSDVSYTFSRPANYTSLYDCGKVITTVFPAENSSALPPYVKHSYDNNRQ